MPRRALLLAAALLALATASAQAIIGGRPASRPYPYMVSLQDGDDHFCGGSLVRPDWVLTAAHCIEGTNETDLANLRAVIGRVKLSSQDGVAHEVDRYVVHPDYDGSPGGGADIALLHLTTPSSQPLVTLAGPEHRSLWEPGDPARVIGWGTSFFLVGPTPDELYEVDVPIVGDDDCAFSYPEYDPKEMVCAGEDTGTRDSCQGDSGGPLLAGDMSGDPVQVGTVSYGIGCGFPVFYGVYGRVGEGPLRDWLERTLPPLGSPAGAAPAPPPAAPATAPPAQAPAAPAPTASATRLKLPKVLGSARRLRRRGTIAIRVRSSAPVTRVLATLQRGNRTIARARAARAGKLTFRLPRTAIRAGRLRLAVRATDAGGRPVSRTVTVRIRR